MKLKTIAIIGLGLMGGSLAAACRKRFPKARLIGITRSRQALRTLLKKRWIHEGTSNLSRGVADANLIVLCTPVDTISSLLRQIDRHVKSGSVVTDVGSLKGNIRSDIQKKNWKNIHFISAHPMVGSHERGISAVRTDLYDHGYTFVIRSSNTEQKAYRSVRDFWKKINRRIVEVTAEEHDGIVSQISHLPHVLALCLVLAVSKKNLLWASSGFRDMTRIAQSSPSIWLPIFRANKKKLRHSLAIFNRELKSFLKFQAAKSEIGLKTMLTQAMKRRAQI